jgi:hypothetical protein
MGVALGPERTTRWLEVSVAGADEGFLWLVPVAPGARVDTTSHAWLDALDAATHPTLLPPEAPSTCSAGAVPVQVTIPSPREFAAPVAAGVAADLPTLTAMVARGGAAMSAEDLTPWGTVLDSGLDVLVVWYERGHPDATTESLRIVESSDAPLDLPSTASPHIYTAASMFVLAGGPVQAGPVALTVDPGAVLWGPDNQTNYAELREDALESAAGAAWLTDSAMPNRLFQPVVVGEDAALPPVLDRYFSIAERRVGGSVAEQCGEQASTTGALAGTVLPLCPPGGLAVVAGPSVCSASSVLSGESVPALPFACGEAVDAAYALAGLVASDVWLTRATGVLLPTGAGGTSVTVGNGGILSAVIAASGYAAPCMVASGAAAATPVPTPPPPPDVGASYDPTPLLNAGGAAADVAEAASDGSDGGCDGDSSDSSSDGGGCDSSSSSSGDSSGSGCSGDSSSDQSSGCSVHKKRHARGEAVRWLMLGVLGVAFARRRRPARQSVSRTSEQ